MRKPCVLDSCDAPRVAFGYCERHYRKFRKYGTPTPLESPAGRRIRSTQERFWEKVDKADEGCWIWTAATYRNGYGNLWIPEQGRKVLAHRYSYELANGKPIPDGLQVCRYCWLPATVAPDDQYCRIL